MADTAANAVGDLVVDMVTDSNLLQIPRVNGVPTGPLATDHLEVLEAIVVKDTVEVTETLGLAGIEAVVTEIEIVNQKASTRMNLSLAACLVPRSQRAREYRPQAETHSDLRDRIQPEIVTTTSPLIVPVSEIEHRFGLLDAVTLEIADQISDPALVVSDLRVELSSVDISMAPALALVHILLPIFSTLKHQALTAA